MDRINYKVLSYIAAMFFIVNILLNIKNVPMLEGYIFLWIALSVVFFNLFQERSSAMGIAFRIVLFGSVLLAHETYGRSFIILICIICLFTEKKKSDVSDKERTILFIENLILLSVLLAFIMSMLSGSGVVNNYIEPYAVLYTVFSILNLRHMRNDEFNIKAKSNFITSIMYFLLMVIVVGFISLQHVRNFIVDIATQIFIFTGFGLATVLNNILIFLYKILYWLSGSHDDGNLVYIKPQDYQELKYTKINNDGGSLDKYIVIGCIALAAVLFIIFMIFMKRLSRKKINKPGFIERKEFIKVNNASMSKRKKYSRIKMGSFSDKIRYCYYKFMKDCAKQNVNLVKSDTTHDINKKARALFNTDNLKDMRSIYLKARYTDIECTKEDYESFLIDYKQK